MAAVADVSQPPRISTTSDLSAKPAYGFAKHARYGTEQHRDAIVADGPCPLNRMSFRPLKKDDAAEG